MELLDRKTTEKTHRCSERLEEEQGQGVREADDLLVLFISKYM